MKATATALRATTPATTVIVEDMPPLDLRLAPLEHPHELHRLLAPRRRRVQGVLELV
eukprot:CAMPEP_0115563934 /NCGR_PEP_ID=MMETSP0271-20121206/102294_1 /TAXON_ID=71861 /ORGANISM="Scrippsiella trochoidea, Strain CCMP3099" /LENGTH=56 /DNA_ID=CAMNT_0002998165 /DNA_START=41 /DNA_END=211 /DNA_ORIENTATION=-